MADARPFDDSDRLSTDIVFCFKCGSLPDLREQPTFVPPRGRYGQAKFRFPCAGRPNCLESLELSHGDLRELAKTVQASKVGVYLNAFEKCRATFEKEAENAAEAKDRIAAAKGLHALSREGLEIGGIIDRRALALPSHGVVMQDIRVLPGSLIDRKLQERARAKIESRMEREVEVVKRNDALVSVPDLSDDMDPAGL